MWMGNKSTVDTEYMEHEQKHRLCQDWSLGIMSETCLFCGTRILQLIFKALSHWLNNYYFFNNYLCKRPKPIHMCSFHWDNNVCRSVPWRSEHLSEWVSLLSPVVMQASLRRMRSAQCHGWVSSPLASQKESHSASKPSALQHTT